MGGPASRRTQERELAAAAQADRPVLEAGDGVVLTPFDAPPPPPPRIADAERLTFTNEVSGGGEAISDAPAGFVWGGVF